MRDTGPAGLLHGWPGPTRSPRACRRLVRRWRSPAGRCVAPLQACPPAAARLRPRRSAAAGKAVCNASTCLAGRRAVRAPPRTVALAAEPSQPGQRTPWRGGTGKLEGIGRAEEGEEEREREGEGEGAVCGEGVMWRNAKAELAALAARAARAAARAVRAARAAVARDRGREQLWRCERREHSAGAGSAGERRVGHGRRERRGQW